MKKKIIACAVLALAGTAGAFDLSTSRGVGSSSGATHSIGHTISGIQLSAAHSEGAFTRYSVGKGFQLAKVGPVAIGASASGVYQNTAGRGPDGYGLQAGVGAEMPLTKNLSVVASYSYFRGLGDMNVSAFNGPSTVVGLKASF